MSSQLSLTVHISRYDWFKGLIFMMKINIFDDIYVVDDDDDSDVGSADTCLY